MAVLRGLSGVLTGTVFELYDGETTFGRHSGNQVQLDEGSVSSFHCTVVRDGVRCTIRDLNSTNSTRVNGEPVTVRALSPGDLVQMGSVEFMYEDENAVPAERPASINTTSVTSSEPSVRVTGLPDGFAPLSKYEGKAVWLALGIMAVLAVVGMAVLTFTLLGLK